MRDSDEIKMRQLLYQLYNMSGSTVDDWSPFWGMWWDCIERNIPISETFMREFIAILPLKEIKRWYGTYKFSLDFMREFNL